MDAEPETISNSSSNHNSKIDVSRAYFIIRSRSNGCLNKADFWSKSKVSELFYEVPSYFVENST